MGTGREVDPGTFEIGHQIQTESGNRIRVDAFVLIKIVRVHHVLTVHHNSILSNTIFIRLTKSKNYFYASTYSRIVDPFMTRSRTEKKKTVCACVNTSVSRATMRA